MKITKEELKQIIREEAYKFKKKLQLESELAEIESQLNEVEAGSLYDAGESAGKKYKAEFEHLDNEFGIPGETETYMEEVEMEEEAYEDVQNEEDLNLEAILAEIMSEDSNEEVAEECGTYEETYMEESDDNDADDLTNELYKEETLSEGEVKKSDTLISEQARMKKLAGI